MESKTWKTLAIILVILIILTLLYFTIRGFINYKYVTLTKVNYGKPGTLNDLLKKSNITAKLKKKELALDQISEILWAGYGKTRNELRTVISFSGYPLHLYICINENDIKNFGSGFFEYLPDIHNLKRIESNGIKNNLINTLALKGSIPLIILITADHEKYASEKEKVFFELGETAANILLKTRELKLKLKYLDKFDSAGVIKCLELENEDPLMIFLLGK